MKIKGLKQEFIDLLPKKDICLLGLQGSRALGLAKKDDADYDYRGIYISSNRDLLSLNPGKETCEKVDARDDHMDLVMHEVGKFFRLALKGNPSVVDLLFLPTYNIQNDIGRQIVANREIFLSSKYIKAAYGGYAMSQILYLKRNHKFTGGKSIQEKKQKHIKHCFRLFDQGQELLETGNITYPLKNPEKYIKISEITDENELVKLFEERNEEFKHCKSILPNEPSWYLANELLLKIRGVYDL